MSRGIADIVDALEAVDALFRDLPGVSERATALWDDGVDKLSKAIWLYEKELEMSEGMEPGK